MKDKDKIFDIEDLALSDEKKHPEPLDMDLEGPDPVDVGVRIAKLFPDANLIDLIDDLQIVRMASGGYTIKGTPLKELATWELEKIDSFLKSKEDD